MNGRRALVVAVALGVAVSVASVGSVALSGSTADHDLASVANDGSGAEVVGHDGDGVPDGDEVDAGTDPADPTDVPATADGDGDGLDDADEVTAETNPFDSASNRAFARRRRRLRQVKGRSLPSSGMVSVVSLVLLGAVLVVNTLIAAVMTRFFRIRLKTRAGSVIYALLLIPVALFVTTMLFGAVIPGNLGVSVLLGLWIGMPLVLGFTIDVLYVPPPDEIELPDTT